MNLITSAAQDIDKKRNGNQKSFYVLNLPRNMANEDWNLKSIKVGTFLKFELFWINNKTIIIEFGFRMIWGIMQIFLSLIQ